MSTPAVTNNSFLRIEDGFLKYSGNFDVSIPLEKIEIVQLCPPQRVYPEPYYSIHLLSDTVRNDCVKNLSVEKAMESMRLILSMTPAKISLEALESVHINDNGVSLDFFHGDHAENFKDFYAPAFFSEDEYWYQIEDGEPNRFKRLEKGNRFTVITKESEGQTQRIQQALENMSKHLCNNK